MGDIVTAAPSWPSEADEVDALDEAFADLVGVWQRRVRTDRAGAIADCLKRTCAVLRAHRRP